MFTLVRARANRNQESILILLCSYTLTITLAYTLKETRQRLLVTNANTFYFDETDFSQDQVAERHG
jgi:hypothetical protein